MKQRVKLSAFAKSQGITYQSAWKMWEKGMIEGIKLDSKTILVSGWSKSVSDKPRAIIYARVNDDKKTESLDSQVKQAEDYCVERNYEIVEIVKEVLPGVILSRPKLIEAMKRDNWDIIVVDNQKIIAPVGYDLLTAALGEEKRIEPMNEVEEVDEELIYKLFRRISMWAKQIYGQGAQKKAISDMIIKLNY